MFCVEFPRVQYIDSSEIVHVLRAVAIVPSEHLNFSGGSRPSGKEGPGPPDPEIRGRTRSQKNFFHPSGLSLV